MGLKNPLSPTSPVVIIRSRLSTPLRRYLMVALGLIAFIWLYATSLHPLQNPSSMIRRRATQNKTLGFGAIFANVMPYRTDQRDVLSLLSYYSDLDIEIVDGVVPDAINDKALPPGRAKDNLIPAALGCWRSHMDVLKLVVDRRIETALILEGDADWDVRVKDQLAMLSDHIPDADIRRPYGYDWTFLWLGACGHGHSGYDPADLGPYVIYQDHTVAPFKKLKPWMQKELTAFNGTEDSQRLIHRARDPICALAYAVTFEGARRMLYEAGIDHLNRQVDVEMRYATQDGKTPGLVVIPPLMAQWRTGTISDSDINGIRDYDVALNGTGSSGPAVAQSARKKLKEWTYENSPLPGWAHKGVKGKEAGLMT